MRCENTIFVRVVAMLVLGLFAGPLHAQPSAADKREFDSLRAVVHRPGLSDTARVRLGSQVCRYLSRIDLDSARRYGEQAVALARRIGFRQGEAQASNNLAAAIFYTGDYPAAQQAFEASLRIAQRAGSCPLTGHAYLGLGNVAHGVGNEKGALAYYEQARATYAGCSPPNVRGQLLVLQNIATNYLNSKENRKAVPAVRQALALLSPDTEPRLRVAVLNLLGTVQADASQPDSAMATWRLAARLAHASQNPAAEALAYGHMAETSLARQQPAAALELAQKSVRLNREVGAQEGVADALHVLAIAMHKLGRPGAFDTLARYLTLRDTLQSQERTEAVAEAQARFDRDEQQVRIRMLEQQQRIAGLEAEQRRTRTRLLLLGAAGIVAALALILARQYRRRQQARELALRRRIAADLHDDVGSLLTQISLQSELLSQGVYGPEQQGRYLTHMAEASRSAVRQMSDVVWGLNEASQDATLTTLLERLREHAHEVLPAAGLEIDFATEPGLEAVSLSLASRQALYLIYKEALHNAVKHARGATEVSIRLRRMGLALWLEVRDNGAGKAAAGGRGGNGLRNMQARAQAVGGHVIYHCDEPGFGVVATLPLT